MKRLVRSVLGLAVLTGALLGGRAWGRAEEAKENSERVFELRTYTAADGKFDDLHKRFRDHTVKLFEKHGMTNVGYWVPAEGDKAKNTLIYVLGHKSRDAAKASWKAFMTDPEWTAAYKASETNGKLTKKVESVYLKATDYSPLK